ncbi:hypothetical protein GPECTOR_72g615 [Gonium pectorale]|uniref:Roc domain-containing protein n=1 Tax=Gonium pectorale TaxID=33097 RepID=A0A150G2V1_GONPE|nr:hypothetical protein GPECTOR_72g615 [Gonium pectorale]|eukprot:KXZ44168.1 hypothetical protein GPECTOR_72g615 [Gonium pectorale]
MTTDVKVHSTTLVLVGPGGSGKTTLAVRLARGEFDPDVGPRDGLLVHEWLVPDPAEGQEPLLVSIWDVGGQEMFWSTDAFFKMREVIYVVVYNTRIGFDASNVVEYLDRIETLAPGATKLVVGTRAWEDGFIPEMPSTSMLEKHGIAGRHITLSPKANKGISDFENAVISLASGARDSTSELPRKKIRGLRERMKKEDKPMLMSLKDVIRTLPAAERQESELKAILTRLSGFGDLLQIQYIPDLEDKVVIDLVWLADVLGDVMTRDAAKRQRLKWIEGYVSMQKVQEEPTGPNEQPLKWWGAKYTFEKYLPDALLCRLLCRLLSLPELHDMKLKRMWRFGVFLQDHGAQRIVVAYEPDQLSSIKYDCPGCLGDKKTRAAPHSISAKAAWSQEKSAECDECGKTSVMSMYASDEQAVGGHP